MPALPAAALTAPEGLDGLDEADRTALERLSVEPASTRELALEAALHPDVLVEMQLLQARTSAAFQARIEDLSRQEQEAVWEIVREPGLLHELAASDLSRETLERIAAARPEHLDGAILAIGADRPALLPDLQAIAADAEEQFEVLIEDLPADSREAYRELVDHPELVTLLATHVRLAVALGDAYREDPSGIRLHLEALGNQVAQREARAREAWQASLEEDPEAAADLEAAARAYAEEEGIAYEAATRPAVETTVYVSLHPYPYWFGYPHWHVHHHHPWGWWHPWPVHFGFYYRPHDHGFVWFGLPSFQFLFWYEDRWLGHHGYRHHRHHGRFYTHYERHRAKHRHRGHARHAHYRRHVGEPRHRGRHAAGAIERHTTRRALRERTGRHGFERSLRPHPGLHRERDLDRGRRDGPRWDRRTGRRGDGDRDVRRGDRRREPRLRGRPGRGGPDLDRGRDRDRREVQGRVERRERREARERREPPERREAQDRPARQRREVQGRVERRERREVRERREGRGREARERPVRERREAQGRVERRERREVRERRDVRHRREMRRPARRERVERRGVSSRREVRSPRGERGPGRRDARGRGGPGRDRGGRRR